MQQDNGVYRFQGGRERAAQLKNSQAFPPRLQRQALAPSSPNAARFNRNRAAIVQRAESQQHATLLTSNKVAVDKFDSHLQDLNKSISMLASRCDKESKLSTNMLRGAAGGSGGTYAPPKGAEERSWMVMVPPLPLEPSSGAEHPTGNSEHGSQLNTDRKPDTARSSSGKRKSEEGIDEEEARRKRIALKRQAFLAAQQVEEKKEKAEEEDGSVLAALANPMRFLSTNEKKALNASQASRDGLTPRNASAITACNASGTILETPESLPLPRNDDPPPRTSLLLGSTEQKPLRTSMLLGSTDCKGNDGTSPPKPPRTSLLLGSWQPRDDAAVHASERAPEAAHAAPAALSNKGLPSYLPFPIPASATPKFGQQPSARAAPSGSQPQAAWNPAVPRVITPAFVQRPLAGAAAHKGEKKPEEGKHGAQKGKPRLSEELMLHFNRTRDALVEDLLSMYAPLPADAANTPPLPAEAAPRVARAEQQPLERRLPAAVLAPSRAPASPSPSSSTSGRSTETNLSSKPPSLDASFSDPPPPLDKEIPQTFTGALVCAAIPPAGLEQASARPAETPQHGEAHGSSGVGGARVLAHVPHKSERAPKTPPGVTRGLDQALAELQHLQDKYKAWDAQKSPAGVRQQGRRDVDPLQAHAAAAPPQRVLRPQLASPQRSLRPLVASPGAKRRASPRKALRLSPERAHLLGAAGRRGQGAVLQGCGALEGARSAIGEAIAMQRALAAAPPRHAPLAARDAGCTERSEAPKGSPSVEERRSRDPFGPQARDPITGVSRDQSRDPVPAYSPPDKVGMGVRKALPVPPTTEGAALQEGLLRGQAASLQRNLTPKKRPPPLETVKSSSVQRSLAQAGGGPHGGGSGREEAQDAAVAKPAGKRRITEDLSEMLELMKGSPLPWQGTGDKDRHSQASSAGTGGSDGTRARTVKHCGNAAEAAQFSMPASVLHEVARGQDRGTGAGLAPVSQGCRAVDDSDAAAEVPMEGRSERRLTQEISECVMMFQARDSSRHSSKQSRDSKKSSRSEPIPEEDGNISQEMVRHSTATVVSGDYPLDVIGLGSTPSPSLASTSVHTIGSAHLRSAGPASVTSEADIYQAVIAEIGPAATMTDVDYMGGRKSVLEKRIFGFHEEESWAKAQHKQQQQQQQLIVPQSLFEAPPATQPMEQPEPTKAGDDEEDALQHTINRLRNRLTVVKQEAARVEPQAAAQENLVTKPDSDSPLPPPAAKEIQLPTSTAHMSPRRRALHNRMRAVRGEMLAPSTPMHDPLRDASEGDDEDEDVDLLTPLDSEDYLRHKRIKEVVRGVGGHLDKRTARRLLEQARGDVRTAISLGRSAIHQRRQTPVAPAPASGAVTPVTASGGIVMEGGVVMEASASHGQRTPHLSVPMDPSPHTRAGMLNQQLPKDMLRQIQTHLDQACQRESRVSGSTTPTANTPRVRTPTFKGKAIPSPKDPTPNYPNPETLPIFQKPLSATHASTPRSRQSHHANLRSPLVGSPAGDGSDRASIGADVSGFDLVPANVSAVDVRPGEADTPAKLGSDFPGHGGSAVTPLHMPPPHSLQRSRIEEGGVLVTADLQMSMASPQDPNLSVTAEIGRFYTPSRNPADVTVTAEVGKFHTPTVGNAGNVSVTADIGRFTPSVVTNSMNVTAEVGRFTPGVAAHGNTSLLGNTSRAAANPLNVTAELGTFTPNVRPVGHVNASQFADSFDFEGGTPPALPPRHESRKVSADPLAGVSGVISASTEVKKSVQAMINGSQSVIVDDSFAVQADVVAVQGSDVQQSFLSPAVEAFRRESGVAGKENANSNLPQSLEQQMLLSMTIPALPATTTSSSSGCTSSSSGSTPRTELIRDFSTFENKILEQCEAAEPVRKLPTASRHSGVHKPPPDLTVNTTGDCTQQLSADDTKCASTLGPSPLPGPTTATVVFMPVPKALEGISSVGAALANVAARSASLAADALPPSAESQLCSEDPKQAAMHALISTNPALHRLPKHLRGMLFSMAKEVKVRKDTVLQLDRDQEQGSSAISLLASGRMVQVHNQTHNELDAVHHRIMQKEQEQPSRTTLSSGDLFSSPEQVADIEGAKLVLPILLRWYTPARVKAEEDCVVYRITSEAYRRVLRSVVEEEVHAQVKLLQGLPLFSWMSTQQAEQMLEHSKLSLLEDGAVITTEGMPQSPSSRVHIVEAGLVSVSSTVSSAYKGADSQQGRRDSRESVLRVQGPGTHVGFAEMTLQRPQQTTVVAVGSALVLSIKAAWVRDACNAGGQWRKLEELKTASLQACSRDSSDKVRVRKVLCKLSEIRTELESFLQDLTVLVEGFSEPLRMRRLPGLPARTHATVFCSSPQILSLCQCLAQTLDAALGTGEGALPSPSRAFDPAIDLPALAAVLSNCSRPFSQYACNIVRAHQALRKAREDALVDARVSELEHSAGCGLSDVLCQPLSFWQRQAALVAELLTIAGQRTEEDTESGEEQRSMNESIVGVDVTWREVATQESGGWVRRGGAWSGDQEVLRMLDESSRECGSALHDMAGMFHTESEVRVQRLMGVQSVPGNEAAFTGGELLAAHRRLLFCSTGRLLHSNERFLNSEPGKGVGCTIALFNDLLLVHAAGASAAPAATPPAQSEENMVVYLAESVMFRVSGVMGHQYVVSVRSDGILKAHLVLSLQREKDMHTLMSLHQLCLEQATEADQQPYIHVSEIAC